MAGLNTNTAGLDQTVEQSWEMYKRLGQRRNDLMETGAP
jgi:hypothetical protein